MGSFGNGNHDSINPLEPLELKKQAHLVIDFLVDYYNNVENYPVRSQVGPGYLKQRIPKSAPLEPEPIERILQDVKKDIIPGLTHWQSPNFFAFFPCTLSIPGFLGEMLRTGFNTPGFNWISSPAATELENTVVEWVGQMLKLPESFLFAGGGGGVIQGTTCEALLSVLVAARDRTLKRIGGDKINKLVVYGSDQTHSAFRKAAKIAGIRPDNIRVVAAGKSDAFALSAEALRAVVGYDVQEGLVPLFLCATVGTTASTAVDPLGELGEVAEEFGMWVHVDGAHAASACICPEYRHFLDGVETTDSFSFNPHKWLFTGLDCCCLWVKEPAAMVESLSTDPEYLRNKPSESNQVVDYKDWQITLSRRFRSMKLWLILRSYGVANLRKLLRSRLKMGEDMEILIKRDKRFELVVPRNFSTVCFRISPLYFSDEKMVNDVNMKLLESINESGEIFMTHAVIGGDYVIRISIGGSLTQNKHIYTAWKVVQNHAQPLLPTTPIQSDTGIDVGKNKTHASPCIVIGPRHHNEPSPMKEQSK